jgi:hypothetical protein
MTVSNLFTTNKNGWWIAIASLFTIAYVGGISFGIKQIITVTFLELAQTVCNGLGILGLWFLGFRLKPFPRFFWRVFFAFDIFVLSLRIVFPVGADFLVPPAVFWSFALLFFAPYYVGLFIYAFHSETIWRSTKIRRSETKGKSRL